MRESEIRIAIAEACGWKFHIWEYEGDYAHCCLCHLDTLTRPLPQACNKGWSEVPPDYPNDLNAMHEAESQAELDHYPLRERYSANLQMVCDRDKSPWPIWRATARQRAEAFLRTLGKWVGP